MKAIIQAGGTGTRLLEITGGLIPKPMVKILKKPILQWQIENLVRYGINDITIIISSNGEAIPQYFGDGEKLSCHIEYIKENEPLGTAGGLYFAKNKFKEAFVLLFGDLMLDVDFTRFVDFHKQKNAEITAFAHPNSHPFDSDLLVADSTDLITKIDSKHNIRDYYYENLTNAGLYVVSPETLDHIKSPAKLDFEKEILTSVILSGKAYAYRSSEYVKDAGTPERYYAVENDCKNGIISAKCLSKKQKCIFLDRDGTINRFGDFVTKADMLFLMDDASESIKRINASEYLAICITNQPVVARGETTMEELHNIHNRMEDLLGKDGAYLNDLFFCPHHPDKGFPGEIKELKIKCTCRKPAIGLLLKAQERYNIDFENSYFVGDTKQDVQTGLNAHCHSVLLTCGDPNYDKKYTSATPEYIASSLHEAIDYILEKK